MTDAETQRAQNWAGEDEDARWRIVPRYFPAFWVVFACLHAAMLMLGLIAGPSASTWEMVSRGVPVILALGLALLARSWTAARSEGLRVRTAWRTREVAWQDVASIRRSRMWGFVVQTRHGASHALQGLTQARLGHLLRIWASHRGESEPLAAAGGRERHGLWAAEPRRFAGARIAIAIPLLLVAMATVVVLMLTDTPPVPVAITAALAVAALSAALCRVLFSGTVLSGDAVKVRTPTRTRSVPWSAVSEVSVDDGEVLLQTGDGALLPLLGVAAGDLPAIEQARAEALTDSSD